MNSIKNIFVSGIGTDVGKTIVSAILTESLQADYWKPIQAGDLDNTDTMKVRRLISNQKTILFPEVYQLKTACSPHLAAEIDGVTIQYPFTVPKTNNHLIIEGAGGLLAPISSTQVVADLILPSYKIILVCKHYLGSINHTLLSLFYLKQKGFKSIGIIYNGEQNVASELIISKMSDVKIITHIPLIEDLCSESILNEANRIQASLSCFLASE